MTDKYYIEPDPLKIRDTVLKHSTWIADHQKKSTRHTIYFGLVVAYVAFDILCRFL